MRVLIIHESRYGSTQGIAERIAATLEQHSVEVVLRTVEHPDDPAAYDAVVIGSATYYFRWMKKAAAFVRRNREALAERPVWLFSSGPLGTRATDDQGRDVRETTIPKEIAEFRQMIHPRDHRVFFGALLPNKMGFFHRLLLKMPANKDHALFPEGDFRDWDDIDAWAVGIAESLKASAASAPLPYETGMLV